MKKSSCLNTPQIETNAMETSIVLKFNLSPKKKKVLEIIQNMVGEDGASIYKTICDLEKQKELPCQQMLIAHCIRELFNCLTRRDENDCLKQIEVALQNVDFIKESGVNSQKITSTCLQFKKEIGHLYNESYKVKQLLRKTHFVWDEEALSQVIGETFSAKSSLEKLRHFNGQLKREPEADLQSQLDTIDNFILLLERSFKETKEIIDSILKLTLKSDYINDDLKEFLSNLSNMDVLADFFTKLNNFKWLGTLKEINLLSPKKVLSNQVSYIIWPALPYLTKAVLNQPIEIVNFILSIFDTFKKTIHETVLSGLLQISCQIPPQKKELFLNVYQKLLTWLDDGGNIPYYIDIKLILNFISKLKSIDEIEKASKFLTILLSLELSIEKNQYTNTIHFEIKQKLLNKNTLSDYLYNRLLSLTEELFKDDKVILFQIYFNTLKNVFDNSNLNLEEQKQLDWQICFHRAAIEKHSQDSYKNSIEHLLISKIRDSASDILKAQKTADAKKIISLMQNAHFDIFTRILLHVLREYPTHHKRLIESYLTNYNYFDNSSSAYNVYHEYYLLLQSEFGKLSATAQNKIFRYISKGPKGDLSRTSDEIASWKFKRLFAIHDDLPDDYANEYQQLLENFQEEPEHPDFLHYISSSYGNASPKEDNEFEKMTIKDIVDFLNVWKPKENRIHSQSILGLSETLQRDISKNLQKYLKNLNHFKTVINPTYINTLFQTLSFREEELSQKQFEDIIHFANWILENKRNDPQQTGNPFDADQDFWRTYIGTARIILKYFQNQSKNREKTTLSENAINTSFELIKKLLLINDIKLIQNRLINKPTEYIQNAINSLHGEALNALIQYGLWQIRVGKEYHNITNILDTEIKEKKYLETFAIIGRHLPWLHVINKKWFVENLDLLLPENNIEVFDIVWLTYVSFVQPFDDMFDILQSKFAYVINARCYSENEDNHMKSGTTSHLAIYYLRGKIDTSNVILKNIFHPDTTLPNEKAFLNFLGRTLSDLKELLIIKRLKDFWEYYLSIIHGKEQNHQEGLKSFMWWYEAGNMPQEWALSQLYNIVVINNIIPTFIAEEEQFLKDLTINPKQVLEIIETISLNNETLIFRDILYNILADIKKDHRSSDLIEQKDALINKLMDIYGMRIYEKISSLLG